MNNAAQPDFIKTISMYRSERGLSFLEARDLAVQEFIRRGWTVPDYERNHGYRNESDAARSEEKERR